MYRDGAFIKTAAKEVAFDQNAIERFIDGQMLHIKC